MKQLDGGANCPRGHVTRTVQPALLVTRRFDPSITAIDALTGPLNGGTFRLFARFYHFETTGRVLQELAGSPDPFTLVLCQSS